MYLSKLIYKTLKAICCHQSNFKGTEKLTNTVKNTENLKSLENTSRGTVKITEKLTHIELHIYKSSVPEPQNFKSFLVHIIKPSSGNIA